MSGKGAETLATLGFAYDNTPDSIKTQAFDKAWKQLNNDIAEKWVAFKLPPGGQAGKIASGKQKAEYWPGGNFGYHEKSIKELI